MKKNFTLISLLLYSIVLNAQVSGLVKMMQPNNYAAVSTLISNYDGKSNIIMSYGHFVNVATPDGITDFSSFYVQQTDSWNIQHLVDLPFGYKVNDIKFVNLKHKQDDYYESYCCFCGTRTTGYNYVYPIQRDTINIVPITNGFVGYFKVKSIFNPSTSDTIVLRDVECSKELHRMTCYAEENGVFSNNQYVFRDNAILDIIGISGTCEHNCNHTDLSAFWRVKFYPEYPYTLSPSGTRWDNNIRYNTDNMERMIDIIGTKNFVVTISHPTNDYKNIWIRYSNKEIHHIGSGVELDNFIYQIKLSSLTIEGKDIQNPSLTEYSLPIRLSNIIDDDFTFAFTAHNYNDDINGIFVYKKPFIPSLPYFEGFYDYEAFHLDEHTYIPNKDVYSYTFHREGQKTKNTGLVFWNHLDSNKHITYHLYSNNIGLNSFFTYDIGYDFLTWSGIHENQHIPPYILFQKISYPLEETEHCQILTKKLSDKSTINTEFREHEFYIQERYGDVYEVTKIAFSPYEVNTKTLCNY